MPEYTLGIGTLACLAVSSAALAAIGVCVLYNSPSLGLREGCRKQQRRQLQKPSISSKSAGNQRPLLTDAQQPNNTQQCSRSCCCSHEAQQQAYSLQHELLAPQSAPKRKDPTDPRPREGYLQWDDYFMALAFLSAQRSKDPNKQVGAVIVGPNKVILSIGYNGFPRGCSDESLPWAKTPPPGSNDPLTTKYPYVVHAEANALLNKNTASIAGASVYVTMFPCNECAKLLIQAGITQVIYHEEKVQERVRVGADVDPSASAQELNGLANGNTAADTELQETDNNDTPSALLGESRRALRCQESHPGNVPHTEATIAADACYRASKRMLTMAGVKLRQHKLSRPVFLFGP